MPKKIKVKPKEENLLKLKNEITKQVIDALKPELSKHIENLRSDILSDFKELPVQKVPVPTPQIPSGTPAAGTPDLSGIVNMLNSGNLDMGKISQMIGGMTSQPMTQANGQPLDMAKLTPGQLDYMKSQEQNKMIATILPLLIGQGGGQNTMITEMMNRIFLEKINSSLYMDKAMLQMMVKNSGIAMPSPTGLTDPITQMAAQQTAATAATATGGLNVHK